MDTTNDEFNKKLAERMNMLPRVVQEAITSADVEKHLRELAERHKLHLDQWELLENEVMLALLGFQPAANLAENIQKEVGVEEETAVSLASDISTIVFAPIRQELERGLDYPEAIAAQKTGVESMRDAVLKEDHTIPSVNTPPVSTPPAAEAPVMAAMAPAVANTVSEPATTAQQAPALTAPTAPSAPIVAVIAATPGTPAPAVTVERSETHPNYAPGAASHERKAIAGDPYREQLA